MAEESKRRVEATIREINRAWREGRVDDLAAWIHPDIVTVVPGFAARVRGSADFLRGFKDFCENATILEFDEHDSRVDRIGHTAVAAFRFEMLYERSGQRYRATGRDLWVFEEREGAWLAVWRTMLDMDEVTA
jgi:ketosteroid isomerase-like protein